MDQDTGKYMIGLGETIIIAGFLIYFFYDKLNWIGRLPGDIRIERDNFRFYFPITTLVLLSLVITLIITIIRRLL